MSRNPVRRFGISIPTRIYNVPSLSYHRRTLGHALGVVLVLLSAPVHLRPSATPSLTNSLMQYVDDGNFEWDDVEFGEAKIENYRQYSSRRDTVSPASQADLSDDTSPESFISRLSCEDETSTSLQRIDQPRPKGVMLKQSLIPLEEAHRNISPKAKKLLGVENDADLELPHLGTIRLTESEWMRAYTFPSSPSHIWAYDHDQESSPVREEIWNVFPCPLPSQRQEEYEQRIHK